VSAYPSLDLKAAASLQSLVNIHALVDCSKRLAWLAAAVLCDLNGASPHLNNDDAFPLVWDVAASHIDIADIAGRLLLRTQHDKRQWIG
jgi:death-on-curing protein